MGRSPLVSVILPAKNCGRYLEEAVGSVLAQTFPDFELIIIDDHSTDESIGALEVDDGRVTIFKNPGAGLIDALNYGAGRARGKFLARMDGDDVCDPLRIERQLDYFRVNEDVGIAGTLVSIFSDDGVGGGYRVYEKWVNSVVTTEQINRSIFIESPLPHPSVMMRRDVFENLGGYRDMGWPEDYDLWLRAYEAGVGMGKAPEVLLRWRESENRASKTDARYLPLNFMRARARYLARTVIRDGKAVIWGAGKTGASLCRFLEREGARVSGFIDIDPVKIGGEKKGRPVSGPDCAEWTKELILVAVASRGARDEIRAFLDDAGKKEGADYFCAA